MTATFRPVSLNDVMRIAWPLMLLVFLTASCGPADDRRAVPAAPAALTNPTAPEVTSSTTPGAARYASSVLVVDVPSAESITVYDGLLIIAQVMLGARPPETRSQVSTVPVSGGDLAVISGTYREDGVAVTSVITGRDGVYVTTVSNSRLADNEVYRLAGGVHTTIAGGPGSPTTLSSGNGDGGPATAAPLQGPSSIAFGEGDDIFIAEYGDGRVRRIDRNGIITTFAGNGTCVGGLNPPTPAPATRVSLCGPQLLAADGAGLLYVARKGSAWIDAVDENGMLRVFATDVDVDALHVAPGGALFASESSRGGRLLRYDKNGHAAVIGTDLGLIADFALAPDGTIYVLHWPPPMIGGRVNRITVLSPR
jgi:hypothetical protein